MERPFSIDHFDHLVLKVQDLEKSVDFYANILGGKIVIKRDDEVSVEMANGMRMTLTESDDIHFNFAIDVVDNDINTVEDFLRSHDLEIVGQDIEHTAPTVRCLDPDGNVVEFRLNGYDAAALQEGGLRK